jgi:hypothetical protein
MPPTARREVSTEVVAAAPPSAAAEPASASAEAPVAAVRASLREAPNGETGRINVIYAAAPAPSLEGQVVARQDANIREAPSRDAEVTRGAAAGTVMRAFQRSGGWVQVGNASPWGWMHASLLDAN